MKILFISMGYPSCENQARLVFLKRLVDQLADQGHKCTVIAPARYMRKGEASLPYAEKQVTKKGNIVNVFFPKYCSVWLKSKCKKDAIRDFSVNNYYKTIEKTVKREKIEFEYVYSHFLWVSAIAAVKLGRKYNVPVFGAAGESVFEGLLGFEREELIDNLNMLSGIVSVSSQNKRILLANGILNEHKIEVFPNAVDLSQFRRQDRIEARAMFNIPDNAFVSSFVGHFIQRKGPLRVLEAVKRTQTYAIFAGSGEEKPEGKEVLFCDRVSPERMSFFLSASDVFVLPTQNEGCCNAIIEAMACGLPIISSNRPFNEDILDDTCSIRVEPDNVEMIAQAIEKIRDDYALQLQLSTNALKKSRILSIEKRAQSIASWMKNVSKEMTI